MRKLFLLIPLLVLVFPGQVAKAQTTAALRWDYGPNETVANVATYTQFIQVDSTVITAVPTCVQNGTVVTCSVPISPLSSGSHTLIVQASRNGISARTTITGLNPNDAPKNPSNPGYQINVTINIP